MRAVGVKLRVPTRGVRRPIPKPVPSASRPLWRAVPNCGTFRVPTVAGGHREIPTGMTNTAGPPERRIGTRQNGFAAMPEPGLAGRERLLCLLALVATFSVVAMSSSLTWPILAESLRLQGYDETAIGLNAASQFAGIMFVAGSATWLIPRLGFFRAALLGLALVAAMLAALPTVRDYWVWLALRFVLGIGNSLLFTAGDTWINQIVENRVRGRWIGVYNTAGMAGWAAGPIIGSQMDPNTWGPFLAGLGGIAIAFAFLLPTRRIDVRLRAGREARAPLSRLLAVFVVAPTVLLSSGMFGVVEGGIQSFAHLYTMDVLGAEFRATGYAVIWVGAVGAIFFQYPVGWLADRVDRGWLLVGCVAVATAAMAIFPWLLPGAVGPWWSPAAFALWCVVVAWGGAMGATFTVGLTLVGERFRDVELVAANAVYSLLFGLGGLAGPFLAGAAMDRFGPPGFPASLFAVGALYTLFAAWRQATRGRRTGGNVGDGTAD